MGWDETKDNHLNMNTISNDGCKRNQGLYKPYLMWNNPSTRLVQASTQSMSWAR